MSIPPFKDILTVRLGIPWSSLVTVGLTRTRTVSEIIGDILSKYEKFSYPLYLIDLPWWKTIFDDNVHSFRHNTSIGQLLYRPAQTDERPEILHQYLTRRDDKKFSLWRQIRATRLEVSQGHQTWYTIPYVRYGFLLVYYSNFVPTVGLTRTRTVSEIISDILSKYEWYSTSNDVIVELKSGPEVTQGHRKQWYIARHLWLPINVT